MSSPELAVSSALGLAFRMSVVVSAGLPELVFEYLDWPSLSRRSVVHLPYPSAGYGGAVCSISPGARYAAAVIYSGQSEVGYELFALTPSLIHLGGMAYVFGHWDMNPLAFSPDERFAALAIQEESLWWVDPDRQDADWDTPATGGVVTWARLLLHDLENPLTSFAVPVLADVPEGWLPTSEDTLPTELRFHDATTLSVTLPWSSKEFRFSRPAPGSSVVIPRALLRSA